MKRNLGFTTISKLVSPLRPEISKLVSSLRSEISKAFFQISKLVVAKRGFTTIELLAFTMILVVVGGLIAGVLYSTLRGSGKAKIGGIVAQNGNYALSVITDIVTSSNAITQINGVDAATCVPSPGQVPSIRFKRVDGGDTTISCANGVIASASASTTIPLIDSTQVEVADCSIFLTCLQSDPYSFPIINVSFKLQDKKNNPQVVESTYSSDFNTAVSMRNYKP